MTNRQKRRPSADSGVSAPLQTVQEEEHVEKASALPIPSGNCKQAHGTYRVSSAVARGLRRVVSGNLSRSPSPSPPRTQQSPPQSRTTTDTLPVGTINTSAHKTTTPSPLSFSVTQASSESAQSKGDQSSKSSSYDGLQMQPASVVRASSPRQVSKSRSLLDMFVPGRRPHPFGTSIVPRSMTSNSSSSHGSRETSAGVQRSSRSGTGLSNASAASSEEHRRRIEALVADYMATPDRQDSGYVNVSREQRRMLLGGQKRADKCELYYEVYGNGPRKLFMIMGMMGCTMYWRLQTRYFAQLGEYTVCVFDNCGSGRSTIAPGPYKISQLAKDACQIMDHLGWTQDIHIVGISMGGMIAQEICRRNSDPHRYASVALVGTWHSSTLAVPTVKEVRFAFNGMAALGENPKHLIKLVFSREWINSPFHDTVREAELCATEAMADAAAAAERPAEEVEATNKDVVMGLFRAIQLDLDSQRMSAKALGPTPETSPGVSPQPHGRSPGMSRMASASQLSPAGPSDKHASRPWAVSHAKTESATIGRGSGNPLSSVRLPTDTGARISWLPAPSSQRPRLQQKANTNGTAVASSNEVSAKRETSGDIHQFMACLGHRFSAQQVKAMQKQNPHTRFLVIHGEKDRVIRPVCGRTLAKILGCPVVWIRGSGHMPPIDAHCTFNLIIRAFTRDERWLRELSDRTCLSPASWDEQVKVRRWMGHSRSMSDDGKEILLDIGEANYPRLRSDSPPLPPPIVSASSAMEHVANGKRTSRIESIRPVGPLHRELLFVDEQDVDLPARVVPANIAAVRPLKKSSSHSSASSVGSSKSEDQRTREMIIYGALLDAPLRIRRYSTAALDA
ncbi:hypothetical protein H4R20_001828 [Coemansia guatemalensis]|uniref:AB hydrolase-1 domain-containing protein n=1 Tax=Coemansia guatemalensis TaxID=2761395 RepID=A0A9W8LVA5_9FUNG|nr:hypothetical protein H4R20_001828 [Coemansia guatemalensis]